MFEFISSKLTDIMAESEQWTQIEKGLFNVLKELGEKEGYSVYVRGVGEGEWLVDLCWCYDKEPIRKWIELACEIEWSSQDRDDIINDMCKLMDVKAYLKLGISSPKLKDKDDVITDVARFIRDHAIKLPGEQYVMVYMVYQPYVKKEDKFNILAYSYDALGNEVFLGEKKVAW
jgi:hypothetical protein